MTANTDGNQNETNSAPTPPPATAAQTETEQAKDAAQMKESKPSITTHNSVDKDQQTHPSNPEREKETGDKTNKEIIYYHNARCQSWISLLIGFLIAGIGIWFLVSADKTSLDKLIGTIVIGTVIEITAWICFYIHRCASNQLDKVGRFILVNRVYGISVDPETRKELAKIITQGE